MRQFLLPLILLFFAASCGTVSPFGSSDRPSEDKPSEQSEDIPELKSMDSGDQIEQGVASWYGPNFDGKQTANGEVYDMNELTAAHRTLPFNSLLEVKNMENGKSVQVRINDRGPYAKNRIIDLSKKAAEEIDMIDEGTAEVSLFLLEGSLADARITDLAVPTFTIQIASYKEKEQALEHSQQVSGSRVETIDSSDDAVYRVYYGVYESEEEAREAQEELTADGIEGYIKQIQN